MKMDLNKLNKYEKKFDRHVFSRMTMIHIDKYFKTIFIYSKNNVTANNSRKVKISS